MVQPTPDGLTLNAGSGGSDLYGDTIGTQFAEGVLLCYSTGDGSANFVQDDTGLPIVPATGATFQLAAGTAAIGKLAANSGVDIGDVDVISIPATATEAAALPSVFMVVAGDDGTDTHPLQTNAVGDLKVTLDSETVAVTQSGAWNVTNISGTVSLPTGAATEATLNTLDGKVTACNTGAVVISSGTVTTVSAVTAITNALPAGDNNIGNVDVVTLPAGNLGMQAMSASLSTVPASDITDATYIGDIKFGESLPAGTSAIGTVTAVGAAAEDAATSGNPVLLAGRYDSSERTTETGDVTTLAASAQGWMMVGNQSSYLFDGAVRCEVKRASGVAATGTVEMIPAAAGKKARILALTLIPTSTTVTNVYVASTTDTDMLGNAANPIPLSTAVAGNDMPGFVLPYNQGGWMQCSTANEAINVILSAAQDVIWSATWIEVN